MRKKIYLSSPHMSDEGYEMMYVNEAFETNWIAPLGPNIDAFENEICQYTNSQYAVALSSGTASIHLALKAAGIGAGDIVFCQSLTFSGSANPILYENAIPVFIGSDKKTWNMSPKFLEEAFIKYPNVKAVIVVNLYGLSADLDRIVDLCKKHKVILIEDAAESLGTKYKGKQSGTFGDYGIFSFNGNKIITTSGGGVVISNNNDKLNKIRFWATQSRDNARHYQHSEIGYNYRMSNVLAGIGRGQLKILNKRIEKKKYIFEFYKRKLSHLKGLNFMPVNSWDEPNYWLTSIVLTGEIKPAQIISGLETHNIEARPIWKPMHLQPVFSQYEFVGDNISEYLFKNGVCLPSDTKLSNDDLNFITKCICKIWEANNV